MPTSGSALVASRLFPSFRRRAFCRSATPLHSPLHSPRSEHFARTPPNPALMFSMSAPSGVLLRNTFRFYGSRPIWKARRGQRCRLAGSLCALDPSCPCAKHPCEKRSTLRPFFTRMFHTRTRSAELLADQCSSRIVAAPAGVLLSDTSFETSWDRQHVSLANSDAHRSWLANRSLRPEATDL